MELTAIATGQAPLPEMYNFTTDCVESQARTRPEAPALWWVSEDGHQHLHLSFADVARQGRKASAFFHDQGIRKGDRVVVILQRVPQWWYAMLGLIRLGAVPIPGTPLLTAKDISYRLEIAQVKAIITDAPGAAKVESFDGIKLIVGPGLPGWTDFDSGFAAAPDDMPVQPTRATDPGIVYFTSGTSGDAKMVLHSQVSYGMAHRLTGEFWLDLKPSDTIWALADTGWGKTAWSSFFSPWLNGACVFVLDMRGKFDPGVILKYLCDCPITVFCAPATALRLLVRKDLHSMTFKALRHCVSAGESLNAPVYDAWVKGTGLKIYEGYGQTEMICLIANIRQHDRPIRPGSMGHPMPGFSVAIVDNDGQPLPAGTEGNLAVRVKPARPIGFFTEYWKNPTGTADRFVGDYYLTGDTATCDIDGYYWFVGRSDDVINSSSYRIGPSEVEDSLLMHSAVLECAAIGVPDDLRGEIVKAFVVLRPGYTADDKLKKELQSHCKKVTAPYKYPRQIEFIHNLPKTVSGKIRRTELRRIEKIRRDTALPKP